MANAIPDDWAGRYARVVAREVRRYREERGMSAQQLSDACADLGMPIHRSVLANFENGRRSNLNLGELLVIARALDVAPIFLMFPLGYEDQIEVLPDMTEKTEDAVAWAAGDEGRRWIAGIADLSGATLYQLRQYEALTLEELRQALELGLHHEGGYEAVLAELAEARKRMSAYSTEEKKAKTHVAQLEQATERTSAAELLAARRRLADIEAQRERRIQEEVQIGSRIFIAEQWKRTGGIEPLARRLEAVQDEIAKRGMKPMVPFDKLFEWHREQEEKEQ